MKTKIIIPIIAISILLIGLTSFIIINNSTKSSNQDTTRQVYQEKIVEQIQPLSIADKEWPHWHYQMKLRGRMF